MNLKRIVPVTLCLLFGTCVSSHPSMHTQNPVAVPDYTEAICNDDAQEIVHPYTVSSSVECRQAEVMLQTMYLVTAQANEVNPYYFPAYAGAYEVDLKAIRTKEDIPSCAAITQRMSQTFPPPTLDAIVQAAGKKKALLTDADLLLLRNRLTDCWTKTQMLCQPEEKPQPHRRMHVKHKRHKRPP